MVQVKCVVETINWNSHYTTDWSAESATNGVMDVGGCMNMLPKDHIYVVQGYSIYIYVLLNSLTYICC